MLEESFVRGVGARLLQALERADAAGPSNRQETSLL
jgi:hypothetical protein